MTNNNDYYTVENEIKKPEKTVYTGKERIFSLYAIVFGYLFVKSLLFTSPGFGLGCFLTVVMFVCAVLIYKIISDKSRRFSVRSILYAVVLLATGSVFLISDNMNIKPIILLFDMIFGLYWLYFTLSENNMEKLDYMIWYDTIKSIFVIPFSYLGKCFGAVVSFFYKKDDKRTVLYFLIGIVAAIIPCAIVIKQLLYDAAFSSFVDKIFSFKDIDRRIYRMIGESILAIPVAFYMFGAIFGASRNLKSEVLSREKCVKNAAAARVVPRLTVYTAITPLIIVYLLFFFTQTAYFTSAFQNLLPGGYTYAEYARSGFFELCRVAVINMLVIAAADNMSRNSDKKPILLKIYNILLSVITLILIVIAQSKIIMYVSEYGLTRLRVYTLWFTVLLFVIFVFIIIKQLNSKINFTRFAFSAFIVLFCILAFTDTDAMIANYNIKAYENNKIDHLDLNMLMTDLSDSALPYILEYYESLPDGSADKAQIRDRYYSRALVISGKYKDGEALAYHMNGYENRDILSFNFAEARAEKMLLETFSNILREN